MRPASHIAALEAPRRDEALRIIGRFLEDKPEPIVVSHRVEATWAGKLPARGVRIHSR
jgi:hypothetical protein